MTLQSILTGYAELFHIYLEITDNDGTPIVSSSSLIRRSIFTATLTDKLSGTMLKTHPRDAEYPFYIFGTLTVDRKAQGFFMLAGSDRAQLQMLSATIKLIMEQYLQTSAELSLFLRLNSRNTLSNLLIQHLLKNPENDEIPHLLNQLEIDLGLRYSVIVIDYSFGISQYFDINLNLGYEHSKQKTEKELFHRVRHHRFLNSRDIVGEYGESQIVIIKSLQKSSPQNRAYKMLDCLCEDIASSMSDLALMSIRISHSCLFDNIYQIQKYYHQANEAIKLGSLKNPAKPFVMVDDILLEILLENLPEQIHKQCIDLRAEALHSHHDGCLACIDSCDALINHNFNQSAAAETLGIHRNTLLKRLDKWSEVTGLRPEKSFCDAMISKLLILSVRSINSSSEVNLS